MNFLLPKSITGSGLELFVEEGEFRGIDGSTIMNVEGFSACILKNSS